MICASSSTIRTLAGSVASRRWVEGSVIEVSMRFLGHNMHIDVRCLAQQFLDGHEVEIVTPPSNR